MSDFKTKLYAAFDKIGTSNGTRAPATQDTAVPMLHEYAVATAGESYFKKRREVAKKALERNLTDMQSATIDKTVAATKKNEVVNSCTLVETDPYSLVVDVKTGASFLDIAKLKVTLAKKHKLTTDQVEELITECTDRREPSQSWKVVER